MDGALVAGNLRLVDAESTCAVQKDLLDPLSILEHMESYCFRMPGRFPFGVFWWGGGSHSFARFFEDGPASSSRGGIEEEPLPEQRLWFAPWVGNAGL